MINKSIFPGDGRTTLKPAGTDFTRGRPVHSITRHSARKLIASFLARGHYFSATGGLLWVHERYCQEAGLDYTVTDHPDVGGWTIQLKE